MTARNVSAQHRIAVIGTVIVMLSAVFHLERSLEAQAGLAVAEIKRLSVPNSGEHSRTPGTYPLREDSL